jgi:cytochrome o ubiquinol oxidase subunit I
MGATRRLDHYEASTGWQPIFLVVAVGAFIILIGATIQFLGLFWSIYNRKKLKDLSGGDPWNGRTLEWSTSSPPPIYNFAVIPTVDQLDPLWAVKRGHSPATKQDYEDIHIPKDTPTGLYIGAFSLLFGFAMTWHIFWLAALSIIAILTLVIIRLSSKDEHEIIPAAKVKEIEANSRRQVIV